MASSYTKEELLEELSQDDSLLNIHLKSLLMCLKNNHNTIETKVPQVVTMKSSVRTIHLISISLDSESRPTASELIETGWVLDSTPKPSVQLYKLIGSKWIVRLMTAVIVEV